MQHDSVIWATIKPERGNFCAFRRMMSNVPVKWCKHKNNVLGICDEKACPLANSRYATIREWKGQVWLYVKTIERAHTPQKTWEKILLSTDYLTALQEIDEHLLWWPRWYIHKCKLRLTKMHQFLIRSRKMAVTIQPRLVRIYKPYEKQQRLRERKARIVAKISNVVRAELLERLHEGVYEGIYNFPQRMFNEVLDKEGEAEREHAEVLQQEADTERRFLGEVEEEEKEIEHETRSSANSNRFVGVMEDAEGDSEYEVEEDLDIENEPEIEPEVEREIEYEYELENGQSALTQSSSILRKRPSGKRKSVRWKDDHRQTKKRKVAIDYD